MIIVGTIIAQKGSKYYGERNTILHKGAEEMTEKQYRKADSMVFPTLMVVMVGIFLNMLGMISTGGMSPAMLMVAGVSLLSAIVTVLFYIKYKGKRICGIYMSIMAVFVCAVMIVFVEAQFFYIVAAPALVAQMAYLERKRIIISSAIAKEQNSLIEETKAKFDSIDNGVNQLMVVIQDFKRVMDDITQASADIANGITELSANSEEVASTSNDGTSIMTKAVDDMTQVKAALTNIYNLAQELKEEYNVE